MSSQLIKLASKILRESYGDVTEIVGTYLMRKGPSPMRLIAIDVEIRVEQVRKALCVLLQQNLISFDTNPKRGYVEYAINKEEILARLRYPNFIYCAKTLYGDAGELIIEELLQNGRLRMSDIIIRVFERLQDSVEGENIKLEDVRDQFFSLVRTHFLVQCPAPDPEIESTSDIPILVVDENKMYDIPIVDIEDLRRLASKRKNDEDGEQPPSKKRKLNDEVPDAHVYWRVNFFRFHAHLRDLTIIEAASNKIDSRAGEVMRTLLRINEVNSSSITSTSPPISLTEVQRSTPDGFGLSTNVIEQYLTLLADESCPFLSKIGDSGGGQYIINYKKIIISLCESHLQSVIKERFGSKSLRIFKLLLMKKHLEQKQIEEAAMINAKEAKEILYKMFGEGFITITEVPKTPDHAPSRTYYLFTVDLDAVARMVQEISYKATFNLMVRREHETKEHKRLLDKQQRVDAILATLEQNGASEEQRQEIVEMITSSERAILTKVKHMTQKLEHIELQMDSTIFTIDLFKQYKASK